jgi:hypothetical protein
MHPAEDERRAKAAGAWWRHIQWHIGRGKRLQQCHTAPFLRGVRRPVKTLECLPQSDVTEDMRHPRKGTLGAINVAWVDQQIGIEPVAVIAHFSSLSITAINVAQCESKTSISFVRRLSIPYFRNSTKSSLTAWAKVLFSPIGLSMFAI